ncbi:hypothetical protein IVB69_09620 [Flavobacterium sp. J49]|uniref:hypothetical protein n=1 Tax=Flavobacterium sp. J49 TaxID=2718534 RepID=UPI001593AFB1|nr:hypothetical protein [Flavobacterium sp. J49]MBF6641738.1 hypothetical protein [Flavobacterium sp. J49]NIC02985.1 hypothetical protein [Flavobacterium sp. J49]
MKNKILYLLLLTAFIGYSQEQSSDSTKTKKVKVDGYFGFNGNINDNTNLNKKLHNANLPELDSFVPELTFGLNVFGQKYSGDIEFGFLFAKPEEGNNEMKYQGFNTRMRVHYNVVNQENFAFTAGLSLAYLGNQYDIYSKNNTIDLNDLEPNNNSGHVSFTNQMLYLGPSVSMYLFKKSSFQVKLNAGYEFALTRGRYDSEFGSVLNNVGESGNNRFVFGITLL